MASSDWSWGEKDGVWDTTVRMVYFRKWIPGFQTTTNDDDDDDTTAVGPLLHLPTGARARDNFVFFFFRVSVAVNFIRTRTHARAHTHHTYSIQYTIWYNNIYYIYIKFVVHSKPTHRSSRNAYTCSVRASTYICLYVDEGRV